MSRPSSGSYSRGPNTSSHSPIGGAIMAGPSAGMACPEAQERARSLRYPSEGMRRMQRPRLQWRPSLLEKFALVGVVPIVALGVVLGYYLKQKIEQRALAN